MKLTHVEVKNFRSLFADPSDAVFAVSLADGMNAFVGPNNTGKSNLLRAIALALDADFPFDRQTDMPGTLEWARPRITLQFASDGRASVEKSLLRYCEQYERSIAKPPAKPFASEGTIRFTVSFTGNARLGATRREVIEIRSKGALIGDPSKMTKALAQLRKSVRLVRIESGVSLEELLAGKFREILHTVIRQAMKQEFGEAQARRSGYLEALQGTLLDPLRDRIAEILGTLFPEIQGASLVPAVPTIDETLSNVTIRLKDAVESSIASKGTGVRGGVMVAMLRYLADQSKRSMVFAVEEPEAFLHPAAQESLRDDLEKLAERRDVSLLVTTHSPFIPSRSPKARVFAVAKDGEGRTRIIGEAAGDDTRSTLLGGLFRDAAVADMIDRSARIPTGARAVVLVEGTTDADYLVVAADKAKRPDLIAGLHLVPTGGAGKLLVEAVLTRAQTTLPVLALLDSDANGRSAKNTLVDRCGFRKREDIVSYAELWPGNPPDVEAEDLFPNHLLQAFVDYEGESTVLSEKVASATLKCWHFGFNATGKDLILAFLRDRATPDDVARWITLLEMIRQRTGLAGPQ
jgi:putative ATP-dependent endonuclease of OLD family